MSDPDFREAHGALATAMWRTEAVARLKLLRRARSVIIKLANQQAVEDEFYVPVLRTINKVLALGGLE